MLPPPRQTPLKAGSRGFLRFRLVFQTLLLCAAGEALRAGLQAAEPAPPLPSVAEVLNRVAEAAKTERENDRAFNEQYSHVRTQIRETRTVKGRLKSRTETIHRHEPQRAGGEAPDGNSHDPAVENEEHDPKKIRRDRDYSKADIPITGDLFDRFDFTILGRETFDGRPAIALEFKPASHDLPNRVFLDRFINRMAGRLWVDEADGIIVKARCHLTEPISFVAGIVGAVYHIELDFRRVRTDHGIWYTPESWWRVDWRELMARKLVDLHDTRTEVQRIAP